MIWIPNDLTDDNCLLLLVNKQGIFFMDANINIVFHISYNIKSEHYKIFSRNLCIAKIVLYFLLEFQAETLYVCPKPCFA